MFIHSISISNITNKLLLALTTSLILVSKPSNAQSENKTVVCRLQYSFSLVHEKYWPTNEIDKNLFVDNDQFKIWLSKLTNDQYEIEIFNKSNPNRSYAKANLSKHKDLLSWSIWDRDQVVDVTCEFIVSEK